MAEENKASSTQWSKAGAGPQNPHVGAKSTLNESQTVNTDRALKTEPVDPNAAASRPKRVRTGCLTCRERHLKCDEGVPDCVNCRKSHRACRRGVRLNFIDTQVKTLPITSLTQDWEVTFQDESREIASEYKGGLNRYGKLEQELEEGEGGKAPTQFEIPVSMIDTPVLEHQQLPSHHHAVPPGGIETYVGGPPPASDQGGESHHQQHASTSESTFSNHTIPTTHSQNSYTPPAQSLAPRLSQRAILTSPEEALYMQAFVEEVGLWMDSMDPYKHFSRLLPFDALGQPMLLNAFLACGARHLTLVNPIYTEDRALHYYDTATRGLLNSLQNPNRNTVICATTAVILNVYEIMSERALQRMNHIAGARALIKECGWNATSIGIGAACFWLNVGMEVLSCLHFNWQVAWDPDQWGVDMDFSRDTAPGREEVWTYRMVYIIAKIANFRSSIPRHAEATHEAEQARLHNRYNEWKRLKDWCDSWDVSVPATMHPLAYLDPYQTKTNSAFPEVWFIKRTTVVARLFYNTAMCLLAQTNPLMSANSQEMHDMQLAYSHQLCGIVAHLKDRGVASVALRSLAIAAECLVVRREQEEVLQILAKINKETGWRVGFLHTELKEKWGWTPEETVPRLPPATSSTVLHQPAVQDYQYQQQPTSMPPAPPVKHMPRSGIVNPLLQTADFSAPKHPYQKYYVAPNHQPQNPQHYTHY